MATKFDLIIEALQKYQHDANKVYMAYLQEVSNFLSLPEEQKKFYISETFESIDLLVKDEIYPYILKTKEFVCKEFLNRVNHYRIISEDKALQLLIKSLNADIKQLYGFIDEDVIINYEKQNSDYFLTPYKEAIESLNISIEIEEGKNYYYLLKDLVQAQKNFYRLSFDYPCEKYCDLLDAKNILNMDEIILQYEKLVLPFDYNHVNKLYLVKQESVDDYNVIKTRYDANCKKLQTLLKQDLESKKLYAFYYFNKFVKCSDICKGYLEVDGHLLRCNNCIDSVDLVLEELINNVEYPNGAPFTPKEKEVLELILNGYSNNEIANTLLDERANKKISLKTVETHITNILKKTGLANKIDLITKFT